MTDRPAGLVRWLPAIALNVVLFWFSRQPTWPEAARGFPDWLLHATAYAAVGASFWYALGGDRGLALSPTRLAAAWGLSIAAGIFDEVHQSFVPGRDASAGDVFADAAGAALAIAVAQALAFIGSGAAWKNDQS